MPILDVEIVVAETDQIDPHLAAALADAAGAVLSTVPGRTWVRVRHLPAERYAENGGGPAAGVHPVFVTVLKAEHPPPEDLRREMAALTQEVARVCDRPAENVHVFYAPEGRGRVAFGGRLVE
jgi:phenylpyruvate tautomerase PptA (4-oxalocrotonate tautomerase family)